MFTTVTSDRDDYFEIFNFRNSVCSTDCQCSLNSMASILYSYSIKKSLEIFPHKHYTFSCLDCLNIPRFIWFRSLKSTIVKVFFTKVNYIVSLGVYVIEVIKLYETQFFQLNYCAIHSRSLLYKFSIRREHL